MSKDIYVLVEHLRGKVAEISYIMLVAAQEITQTTGGEVVAVLLGHGVDNLAQDLAADRVFLIDQPVLSSYSPDAYLQALSSLIENTRPRVFLFGHTSLGMDISCGLGVKHNIPVISQCQRIFTDNDQIYFVCQICGGKIMTEGKLPEPAALVNLAPGAYKPEQGKSSQPPAIEAKALPALEDVKVKLVEYVELDEGDVDISKEPILIAVGRGLKNQDDLELVTELAQALGAEICASRPIIDQGWLPTSRLVGKSGKAVAPKLYLALGISGAPEHVESIMESKTIIAINVDPTAPIFDVAHYGSEIDLFDLIEDLTERVQETKKINI